MDDQVDPRPDLEIDHPFWQVILTRAAVVGDDLFGLLRGYRACGARLVRDGSGYKLLPPVDFGPGTGWNSMAEWNADRTKWLKPMTAELKSVLT